MTQLLLITFQGTLRRVLVPLPLQHSKPNAGLAFSNLDAKVKELFSLPSSVSLLITYIDAEGDVVTLANDDDYGDACIAQALNPLKLNVETMRSIEGPNSLVDKSTLSSSFMRWWKRYLSSGWQKEPSLQIIHHGVRCDCCGMTPIEGPRYSSTKSPDYDLCTICFKESGNCDGYVKMESPLSTQLLESRKDLEGENDVAEGTEAGTGFSLDCKLSRALVCHYTVAPGDEVSCVWQMQNSGRLPWPKETKLVPLGGNSLSHDVAIGLQLPEDGLPCDEKIDVVTRILAPKEVGQHVGAWSLITPSGMTFGERPHLVLEVVDDSRLASALDQLSENLVHESDGPNYPLQDLVDNAKTNSVSRRDLEDSHELQSDSTSMMETIDGGNLRSTVDSLVSVAGWDPLLKELEAMVFLSAMLRSACTPAA